MVNLIIQQNKKQEEYVRRVCYSCQLLQLLCVRKSLSVQCTVTDSC